MKNQLNIDKKINSFKKTISVEGDKSLSIRWVLLSSLSKKKSTSYNLLKSEDVLSAISCIEKLGAKVRFLKNKCEIIMTEKDFFKIKDFKLQNINYLKVSLEIERKDNLIKILNKLYDKNC